QALYNLCKCLKFSAFSRCETMRATNSVIAFNLLFFSSRNGGTMLKINRSRLHSVLFIIVLIFSLFGPHGQATAKTVQGSNSASGVAYNVGDIFAGVGNGKIKHFSPNGVLLDTLDTTTGSSEDSGMAFGVAGNLYAANWTANSMSQFD